MPHETMIQKCVNPFCILNKPEQQKTHLMLLNTLKIEKEDILLALQNCPACGKKEYFEFDVSYRQFYIAVKGKNQSLQPLSPPLINELTGSYITPPCYNRYAPVPIVPPASLLASPAPPHSLPNHMN
jgi:hypothetical protein